MILTKIPLIVRYGFIGVLASLVYQVSFVLTMDLPLLYGNFIAVSMSAVVSYFGHHSITFLRKGNHQKYFSRFGIQVALTYLFSTLILRGFLDHGFHYFYAIATVWIAIPIINFMIMQFWTFILPHDKADPSKEGK